MFTELHGIIIIFYDFLWPVLFSTTFQAWKMVFLNSMTFNDQGHPDYKRCVTTNWPFWNSPVSKYSRKVSAQTVVRRELPRWVAVDTDASQETSAPSAHRWNHAPGCYLDSLHSSAHNDRWKHRCIGFSSTRSLRSTTNGAAAVQCTLVMGKSIRIDSNQFGRPNGFALPNRFG